MKYEHEIERKFLVDFPKLNDLNIIKKLEITQTYLTVGEKNCQRRIRKIVQNSTTSYVYTEKNFITPITREEYEIEISFDEYSRLKNESDTNYAVIKKTRYLFEYLSQYFELDTYPFSNKFAILELELSFPEQEIFFPDYINVIKDVSADKLYSNAALATAGCFPNI